MTGQATRVTLAQLSISMEEGTVVSWLVRDGAEVVAGAPIVEIETDKATVQVEAPVSGHVRHIAPEGAILPVDALIAEIDTTSAADREPAEGARHEAPKGVGRRAPTAAEAAPPELTPTSQAQTVPVAVSDASPGEPPTDLSRDELLDLYGTMARIRAFEEQVVDAYNARLVPGSTHPCIGQEASKVGTISALAETDLVLATYRGHGEAIALGVDPVAIMAEVMARSTGVCKGKGGSMHLSDPGKGLVMTNAIVAAHIPIAGGVALSCKQRDTGQVVACLFGDGASCEGEFFETLNMAQLWMVPLVLICENNGWAISVPTSASQATPDVADRARGFGMHATIVDGNDVLAVRAAVGEAVDRARSGRGPVFVEAKTVRWERHSALSAGADPEEGRRAWQSVDPILRFRKSLLAWALADETELDEIDEEAVAEARECRSIAEQAPFPDPASVYEDVYATARPG
jgi:acetoin:2,6-dichlorophenolindophenol oxidoreductase subunit alpha